VLLAPKRILHYCSPFIHSVELQHANRKGWRLPVTAALLLTVAAAFFVAVSCGVEVLILLIGSIAAGNSAARTN
jgi:hypothetical protein